MMDLRKALIHTCLSDIFRTKGLLTATLLTFILVAVLVWNVYRASDRTVESRSVTGTLSGVHHSQTNLGSVTPMLSVELKNGTTVLVQGYQNMVVKSGAKVSVIVGKTESGRALYSFNGYVQ
jgi:hypothetical protein